VTFQEIVERIADRLNIPATATASLVRIGRSVNDVYREITTSIGIDLSRHTPGVSANTTQGVQTVTFTGIEKIERILDTTSGSNRVIPEVTFDQIRDITPAASDTVRKYAIESWNATSVTIRLDVLPQTVFALIADGYSTTDTLSGTDEPAFPPSFHDILIDGVLAEEYAKLEKVALSDRAQQRFEKRLSDLRMWRAKSISLTIRQGETRLSTTRSGSGSGSGGSGTSGGTSYTQTGLITFDRDPDAPFAVTSGSAVVPNLDADKLDGQEGSYYLDLANHTGTLGINVVSTTSLNDDAVTFAKIQNITSDRLLGRDTASSGNVEELTVGGGLEFTGSGGIQTAAFTGDVTKSAGSTAQTIANDAVTYAKMQNVSAASKLLGRGSAAGSGDVEEITLGTGLSMSGTTLNSSSVAGSNTQVQFNDGGVLGADAGLTYDKTNDVLSVGSAVKFPAAQSASSDVNALDDYEEGTWTPTDGSGAGLSFSSVLGTYIKIGQLVIAWATITFPATGNGANAAISGLPFTSQTTASTVGSFMIANNAAVSIVGVVRSNSTTFDVLTQLGLGNIANSTISGGTTPTLKFTVMYRASS
jgi:hypothetical protein